jgi:predicted nucleotidyltransferase
LLREPGAPTIEVLRLSQRGTALAALCRRFGVRQLDLFGSAVAGDFDPERSDLDFLVLFQNLAHKDYARAYFGLRDGLADLFERPVDLVTEAGLENPYLRQRVDAERVALYAA